MELPVKLRIRIDFFVPVVIPAHEGIRNDAKANEHQSAEAEGDYVANADVLLPNFSQVARRLDLDLKLGEVPEQPRVVLNRK